MNSNKLPEEHNINSIANKSIIKLSLTNTEYFVKLSYLPSEAFGKYGGFMSWLGMYFDRQHNLPTESVLKVLSSRSEYGLRVYHQFCDIMTIKVDPKEFDVFFEMVLREHNRKKIIKATQIIINGLEAKEHPANIIEKAMYGLQLHAAQDAPREHSLQEDASTYVEECKKNNDKTGVIPFGYTILDNTLGGVKGGDLVLVLGPTGGGKSVMLVNFAANMIRNGKRVLLVTLEIPLRRMVARLHACLLGLDYTSLIKHTINLEDYDRALKELKQFPGNCKIVDLPIHSTASQFIPLVKEYKPDVMIIDYIGLMKALSKQSQDWLDQMEIANELKGLARSQKIPIITAAQLNRGGVAKKENASFIDSSRSFQITHPCSFVFRIFNFEDGTFQITTEKTNDSPPARVTLAVDFSKQIIKNEIIVKNTDQPFNSRIHPFP